MSLKALSAHLKPFQPFLEQEGVSEICVNRPHEIWVERHRQFTRFEVPELTLPYAHAFMELVAERVSQGICTQYPLLSTSLPDGARIQCVRSPACESDKVVISIRRHGHPNLTLNDYEIQGAFKSLQIQHTVSPNPDMKHAYEKGDIAGFLKHAIYSKKNMLISGGTGTGKTTFLNACLKEIPLHERLITLEDTREVVLSQPNSAHLLASKGDQGTTKTDLLSLFEACLRLRPDRILLSELRGKEAFAFLRAANSGHPGSLSTLHADTPERAFEQLLWMLQQAGLSGDEKTILRYIKSVVPIVIQLKRNETGGFTSVSDIYWDELHAA